METPSKTSLAVGGSGGLTALVMYLKDLTQVDHLAICQANYQEAVSILTQLLTGN